MDPSQFDHLSKAVAASGSRRTLAQILAALPIVGTGGLLAKDAEAKRRQKRRQDRDREDERDDVQDEKRKKKATLCLNGQTIRVSKKKKKKFLNQGATPGACPTCVPDARTTTCAGKCSNVTNNCGTVVDCGSCDCNPPCGECMVCEGSPGECFPVEVGTPCGSGPTCANGIQQRQDACDSNGICQDVAPTFCDPFVCDGDVCGSSCASDSDCVSSAFCNQGGRCAYDFPPGEPCDDDDECISGSCCSGTCQICCNNNDCSDPTPICVDNVCQPCNMSPGACPSGTCCDLATAACVDTCPQGEVCSGINTCTAPCSESNPCSLGQLCNEGICRDCNVLSFQNLQDAIDASAPGATLYVCAGTYASEIGEFEIEKSITLIGAGDGVSGTLLDDRVRIAVPMDGEPPVVTLRSVRIRGDATGILLMDSSLTMDSCTVFMSTRGINNNGGSLLMHNCTVRDNILPQNASGAGINNVNGSVELHNCVIEGNSGFQGGGIWTLSNPSTRESSVTLFKTRISGNMAESAAGILNVNATSTVNISDDSVVCANDPVVNQCIFISQSRCFTDCP